MVVGGAMRLPKEDWIGLGICLGFLFLVVYFDLGSNPEPIVPQLVDFDL